MTNVVNGAPAWLAPDFRYSGDDWVGANALTYVVYETAPVLADDGSVTTPGVPRDLTGCTVAGTIQFMSRRCAEPAAPAAGFPTPAGAVVNAAQGLISLSLTAAQTAFARQSLDAWGSPARAQLLIQPKVVDVDGNTVTIGLQPLFVF